MKRRHRAAIGLAFGAAAGTSMAVTGCGSGEPVTVTITASGEAPGASSSPITLSPAASPENAPPSTTEAGNPSPVQSAPRTVRIGRVVLGKVNFCDWTPNTPEPLVAKNAVEDDGRCNFPQAAVAPWDPANDPQQTGIDILPVKGSGHAATAPDGTTLYVNCVTRNIGEGGLISDANGNTSNWWLQVDLGASGLGTGIGYVPEVNAGYDANSLLAANVVQRCASIPTGIPMQ